ncbi:redoxin domain-containing protein [Roseibium sp. TrichSKD4]|uniref:peroxiredoxin n=1 Tax=Roseibium sp. TrichSKD4 TaxID=744980 RepID=UPI0001E5615E|nr:peroxiredoxin [Roseibium sp. TrichSKD4]EFO32888.1 redoxin domain-containing protein [Roseibium sp. TrichSKD4]
MGKLETVDWSTLPRPEDDGACDHLNGAEIPNVDLTSTNGSAVQLAELSGTAVFYVYPMTGRPDRALPDGWNDIPGARGCTPQSCSFRDHYAELAALGVEHVFGISTQTSDDQLEAAERLHLPFALLSDADLKLARALDLPTFQVDGKTLIKRLTLIVKDGIISNVFYPVFPPDRNAQDVIDWLAETRS